MAIAWHRRRGGGGIIAGLTGGVICYGGFSICYGGFSILLGSFPPHNDPFSLGLMGDFLIFSAVGATHGLILGLAAWGMGTIAGVAADKNSRKRP